MATGATAPLLETIMENRDLEFIEMAKAAGVYGEDWHDDILEFAYMVAKAEQEKLNEKA